MFFPSFGPPPSGIIHVHEFAVAELLALLQHGGFEVSDLETFNHESGPEFNHDHAYRSKALLPAHTISRWGLEDAPPTPLQLTLEAHPLRGDYIFVSAAPSGVPNSSPYAPLFYSPR